MNVNTPKTQEYSGWIITIRGEGFMPIPDPSYFVASFEVIRKKVSLISIFAFGVSIYEVFKESEGDTPKLVMAVEEIKKRIDEGSIDHMEEYIYECYSSNLLEFENRPFWNKTLKNYSHYFQLK